jgi:PIN domain nuclease of toxin-antitoxin system
MFHTQNGENLDKNVASILDDYENLIYVSSEVIKETMHLIRYKKINVKQWKGTKAQAITNKMALISSDQQFRHYKKQGLSLVFNNTHGK